MNRHREKICVVGLGYIGLPTAALLANRGYDIHGVDISQHAVDTINDGKIHIVEPELDTFVHAAVASGKLKADMIPSEADIFILAVPTPFHHTNDPLAVPKPNIDYVLAATRSIAPFVREGNIVILESTSPVGTTDKVAETLAESGLDISTIHVAHCPERVLPGHIMRELVENDRIVGGTTLEATAITAKFYRSFVEGEVLETDAKTAEMAKLTENSFRDVNIAFANELSLICDKLGMDVWELIRLANRHPRVNILQPGCGVGGHCIAVDPWFIVDSAPEQARLIRTAREVNDNKPHYVVEKVKEAVKDIQNPKIACLGLAFKPDIDDLRESPALDITKMLSDIEGAHILAVEPNIEELPNVLSNRKNVTLVNLEDAQQDADVLVILVKHREFIQLANTNILDFVSVK
jgi:UDP-N-acetyl-D-mannosaminuronic acid dehydrogenase